MSDCESKTQNISVNYEMHSTRQEILGLEVHVSTF